MGAETLADSSYGRRPHRSTFHSSGQPAGNAKQLSGPLAGIRLIPGADGECRHQCRSQEIGRFGSGGTGFELHGTVQRRRSEETAASVPSGGAPATACAGVLITAVKTPAVTDSGQNDPGQALTSAGGPKHLCQAAAAVQGPEPCRAIGR